eukprot:2415619-Amphidinium_carterae.1
MDGCEHPRQTLNSNTIDLIPRQHVTTPPKPIPVSRCMTNNQVAWANRLPRNWRDPPSVQLGRPPFATGETLLLCNWGDPPSVKIEGRPCPFACMMGAERLK